MHYKATPATSALQLRYQYLKHVVDEGTCSEEHCVFAVSFTEWESLARFSSKHPWAERPVYYLVRALRPFGLRLNGFTAKLSVERGTLRALHAWFYADYVVYGDDKQHGFLSTLIVGARTVGNFRQWVNSPQLYVHPNFLVWKPSACTGCSGAMHAEFTWQASREEFGRALNFDLSCVTRTRDCRTPEEFLPQAAKTLEFGESTRNEDVPCDMRMARILGRDSDFVDIVRTDRVKPGENGKDAFVIVDYSLVQKLKGTTPNLNNVYHQKELASISNTVFEPLLVPGNERIIFLNRVLEQPTSESHCAVMFSSQENAVL